LGVQGDVILSGGAAGARDRATVYSFDAVDRNASGAYSGAALFSSIDEA